MKNTSRFFIYKLHLRDKNGLPPNGKEIIIYIVYDILGNRVHSHHVNGELEALKECYNQNLGNIIDYNISPKKEGGNIEWSLDEVTNTLDDITINNEVLTKDDNDIKNGILEYFKTKIKDINKIRKLTL